jgi:hypothetical protein
VDYGTWAWGEEIYLKYTDPPSEHRPDISID